MPTVAEILKTSGFTDEQITALDENAVKAFTGVLTAAEAERNQAEIAQRAATAMFENEITPALNSWGIKEAELSAQRDYYKTLAEKAKDGGFIAEVPPFKADAPRDGGGRFVPNANQVPGSPDFKQFEQRLGSAFGTLADLQWRYRKLNSGQEMPDSPTKLSEEADAQRMSLPDYVAKKYDFAGREAAIRAEDQKKHDDAIRAEVTAAKDKEFAEKYGSNPNIRAVETSRYTELKKGVAEGKREDPLKMTREQRHLATAAAIRQDIAATVN